MEVNKETFQEYLNRLVHEELSECDTEKCEDEIDETTATGGEGAEGYMSPNAFVPSTRSAEAIGNNIGSVLGYTPAKKTKLHTDKYASGGLEESFYMKDDNLSTHQKINLAMRESRDKLAEVEKLMRRAIMLKTETNVNTSEFGKRTYTSLKRINEIHVSRFFRV